MKLTGELRIEAPREAIFGALRDPQFFASCIDGVRDLTPLDEKRYEALLETKVAYINLRFKVTVELTRVEPPEAIEASIEGTPLGVVGRLKATSLTRCLPDGNGTRIEYVIDAAITGKLGTMGQPVIKSKAKEMEKQFLARIRSAFETPAPEAP